MTCKVIVWGRREGEGRKRDGGHGGTCAAELGFIQFMLQQIAGNVRRPARLQLPRLALELRLLVTDAALKTFCDEEGQKRNRQVRQAPMSIMSGSQAQHLPMHTATSRPQLSAESCSHSDCWLAQPSSGQGRKGGTPSRHAPFSHACVPEHDSWSPRSDVEHVRQAPRQHARIHLQPSPVQL